MTFPHEAHDFADLVAVVAARRRLAPALVEKDYWVTHVLWGLHRLGLEIWFKGGTSLSKGFGLIERFSEDLDLKVEPGSVKALTSVKNWKGEGTKAVKERRDHFGALLDQLRIPGVVAAPDPDYEDPSSAARSSALPIQERTSRISRTSCGRSCSSRSATPGSRPSCGAT